VAQIKATQEFSGWLDNLRDLKGRARIQARIERLAAGNPGQHRNLKRGVSELKIDVGPDYRVYYTNRRDILIILLCGGDKSTQRADIRLAYDLVENLEI
jgi:putative addiction module killer protein